MRVAVPPGCAGAGAVAGGTVDDAVLRQSLTLLCLLLSDTEGQRPWICFPIGLVAVDSGPVLGTGLCKTPEEIEFQVTAS